MAPQTHQTTPQPPAQASALKVQTHVKAGSGMPMQHNATLVRVQTPHRPEGADPRQGGQSHAEPHRDARAPGARRVVAAADFLEEGVASTVALGLLPVLLFRFGCVLDEDLDQF